MTINILNDHLNDDDADLFTDLMFECLNETIIL